ncbi:MAG: hypothetical protein ACHRHE_06195 [Tepidisphaerales bacterium]
MKEERGQIAGNQIISEPFTLWGSIGGEVIVVDGGKMYVRGAIYGLLSVEKGGRVHILGNVSGDLRVARGAKVIVSGIIGGDCTNNGGRLYVDETARILGKVRTRSGETKIDSKAQVGGRENY